jgi:hypothetical protein
VDLHFNLDAKALGLIVPQSLLAAAERANQ